MTFMGWGNELEETEWNFTETHRIMQLERKIKCARIRWRILSLLMNLGIIINYKLNMCQQCDVAAERQM